MNHINAGLVYVAHHSSIEFFVAGVRLWYVAVISQIGGVFLADLCFSPTDLWPSRLLRSRIRSGT
eukprot:2688037-Pyramimonas_sp.AAC.1